jgi:REP element-mobilizing transposase RayT
MSSRSVTKGSPKSAQQLRMQAPGFRAQRSFGGVLSPVSGKEWKSNPKTARPVAVKQAMHVVLRSSLARDHRSLLLHDRTIQRVLQRLAKRFHIRLYDIANSGNHLHLILRLPHREALSPFLKAATGLIARLVLKVERGQAWRERPKHRASHTPYAVASDANPVRFWDARPWTRIVSFGPDFKRLKDYLMLNRPWPACAANRADLAGFTRASYRAMLKEVRRLQATGALERLPSFGFDGPATGFS